MKMMFLLLMLLSLCTKTFTQDYYQKSRTQKTIAWGLLGVGTTMIVIAAVAGVPAVTDEAVATAFGENSSSGADAWGTVMLIGIASDFASIPFFISASKNKRLAGEVQLNNQQMYLLQKNYVGVKYVPGVTIKISLER